MGQQPFSMSCPQCRKTLRYGAEVIGKKARCPGCGVTVCPPSPEATPSIPKPLRSQSPGSNAPITSQLPAARLLTPAVPPSPPALPPESIPPAFDFSEQELFPSSVPSEEPAFVSGPIYSATGQVTLKRNRKATPTILGISLGGVVIIVAVVACVIYATNNSVNAPLQKVIADDSRNHGIEAKAYYGDFGLKTLVFDLRNVSGSHSRMDVFRVFLHYAASMKDKQFDSVQLTWRGKAKFVVDGQYFKKIGQECDFQNPVYTIRTFPENLRTPEGNRAFSVWEGGMLGVLKAQMDDFNHFHDQWYLDDLGKSI